MREVKEGEPEPRTPAIDYPECETKSVGRIGVSIERVAVKNFKFNFGFFFSFLKRVIGTT